MMKCKLHILLSLALISAAAPVFGISPGDNDKGDSTITYRHSFGVGSDKVIPNKELLRFTHKVDSLSMHGAVGNVSISGAASIDGSPIQNEFLASGRAMAMKDWFAESTDLPANKILLFDNGADWEMFRSYVVSDRAVPLRQEVLGIIDSDASILQKNRLLKALAEGETWKYLAENIFPQMRVAIVSLEILDSDKPEPAQVAQTAIRSEVAEVKEESASTEMPVVAETVVVEEAAPEAADCLTQRMALKTNLLYDAALMPSLELEYRFNNRWSVALEGNVAWWKNDRKHKYYQIATIIPEVRYHLTRDCGWHGHYLGLFTGGGKYDLENGKKGYYGEGGMLGVSYNYVFNVGRKISFEAGIGVGAMYTRYKEYVPVNGYYLYQQTKHLWYGGPLRLKFALVWRFWDNKSKGGDK